MWACAHWCVSPNAVTTQQSQIPIYAAGAEKTNRGGPRNVGTLRSFPAAGEHGPDVHLLSQSMQSLSQFALGVGSKK